MSVSMRDPVIALARAPLGTRAQPSRPHANLEAVLEGWRRLVPEAAALTLSATLPIGVDAQRGRRALLDMVAQWARLPRWFERSALAFDVSATGTATDFCQALGHVAASADIGLVLDLPALSRHADPHRSLCDGPEALRRMGLHLQPHLLPTLTLATRWLRSRDDAQWAIEQGLPVRLVPGADADPRQPQRDPGAGVRTLVRQIAGKVPHVTLAWPEAGAALEVMRCLRKAGTACDLELTPGSAWGALRQVARAANVGVRVHGCWQALGRDLSRPHSGAAPQ